MKKRRPHPRNRGGRRNESVDSLDYWRVCVGSEVPKPQPLVQSQEPEPSVTKPFVMTG